MYPELLWGPSTRLSAKVIERRFTVDTSPRPVPGAIWLPAPAADPPPVVLLGHGGASDKFSSRNRRLAALLVAAGFAAVAIDGPFHGDRVAGPLAPQVYQRMILEEGVQVVVDRMTSDWQATLAVLQRERLVQDQAAGYIGHSMGARYGLPLAAILGDRLGALVIGKFGLQQTSRIDPRLHQLDQIRANLQAVRTPTLIHLQWDDEVFPRAGGLAMFDHLGAPDKQLIVHPGPHSGAGAEAERQWVSFVESRLIGPHHRPSPAITPDPRIIPVMRAAIAVGEAATEGR